jgi:sarcosine oxidase subunit alpha
MRSTGRRVGEGVARGAPFVLTVDGEAIEAYPGETVATALLAAGRRTARRTAHLETQQGFGPDATAGIESDR